MTTKNFNTVKMILMIMVILGTMILITTSLEDWKVITFMGVCLTSVVGLIKRKEAINV